MSKCERKQPFRSVVQLTNFLKLALYKLAILFMTLTPEQRAVCERFGSEAVPCDPQLKLGIALGTLHLLPLNALRHRLENGTCGWYIYGGENSSNPDFYKPLHAAHVGEYCPAIVPYLALAPGWGVVLAPEYEDVWFDEKNAM